MADNRKVAMDQYVRDNGTGVKIEVKNERKIPVVVDQTVCWELVSKVVDWQSNFINQARMGIAVNLLSAEEAEAIFFGEYDGVDFLMYLLGSYDPIFNATFSTYVISQLHYKFLDHLKKHFDKNGAYISEESLEAETGQGDDGDMAVANKIGEEDARMTHYEFGECLIEFCSNMLNIVKSCNRTKATIFRILYTDKYITVARTYDNIDMDAFRHRKELSENLDHDMIGAVFGAPYNDIKEYIEKDPVTAEALSNYYGDATKKNYYDIFTEAFRDRPAFKECIPFPIKPADILRACLYIKENKDVSEEEMEQYYRASNVISKYRKEFDENVMIIAAELFSEIM